ncbi:MAG: L-lactate dehydrogenase [Oscillospiraceae bacterium]|nr:L-lactate dehydrogenase [Oscillospiraceae bacterium]
MPKKKAAVIGAGLVGATAAFTMLMNNTADELVLIDVNRDKAEGDALDMNHGMSFLPPVKLTSGWYEHCRDAALIVLTAGAAQKPGESRMDLLGRNLRVFDDVLSNLLPNLAPNALLLTVTNPVDVLTQYVLERSGLPPSRVMGSGTVLDTSRLKWAIAEHIGLDSRDVKTFVIGEHGDTAVAAFSATAVSGMRLDEYCAQCPQPGCDALTRLSELHREVRGAAYDVIAKKGATHYAVALAVNRVAEAALNDQKAVLTVSGLIEGAYGIKDVCLSLPRVVGAGGMERLLEVPYSKEELAALRHSAEVIREAYRGGVTRREAPDIGTFL